MGLNGVCVHSGNEHGDGSKIMQRMTNLVGNLITWKDGGGHSFVDYALMAIFVGLSVWVVMPGGVASRSKLFMREAKRSSSPVEGA